jgi:hypothetical protein
MWIGEIEGRAETGVMVFVQATLPATQKGRADTGYMAVSCGLFKAVVLRMVNDPNSKLAADVLAKPRR